MNVLETLGKKVRKHPLPAALTLTGGLLLGACSSGEQKAPPSPEPSASAPSPSGPASVPETTSDASPTVIGCDPSSEVPYVDSHGQELFCEEVQATGGVTVLEDYRTASGEGITLSVGSVVLVLCLAEGPADAAPSAASNPNKPGVAEWYSLDGIDGYAASNAFWNVRDRTIPFEQQPTADERVPICPD